MRTIWHAILWLDRLSIRAIARQAHRWLLRRHWRVRAAIVLSLFALLAYLAEGDAIAAEARQWWQLFRTIGELLVD
jgi:hypothetical protein